MREIKEENMMTECELLVMKAIWSTDEIMSIKGIQALVNEAYNKDWKIQTVSTFLARLVKKEYLRMERRGRSFFYYPLVKEEDYGKLEILKCVDMWGKGKIQALLSAFSEVRGLTKEDKKSIREIIENGDSKVD